MSCASGHSVAVKEMGALEYDPASGVYRPAKRG